MPKLLVVTPQPRATESLYGYILRISHANGHDTPYWFMRYAGLGQKEMQSGLMPLDKIEAVLGSPSGSLARWSFYKDDSLTPHLLGHQLIARQIRYGAGSFCPACVEERGFVEALWDARFVLACPRHRCQLLSKCPTCDETISWFRPGPLTCRCRSSWSGVQLPSADQALCELSALVASKLGIDAPFDNQAGLPLELQKISLRTLLFVIAKIGKAAQEILGGRPTFESDETVIAAANTLRDWPHNFHGMLRRLGSSPEGHLNRAKGLRAAFETFHTSLFNCSNVDRVQVEFIYQAWLEFGVNEWGNVHPRMLREGQQRKLLTKHDLANRLKVTPIAIGNLVRRGRAGQLLIRSGRSVSRVFFDITGVQLITWPCDRFIDERKAAKYLAMPVRVLNSLRASGDYRISRLGKPFSYFHQDDLDDFRNAILKMRSADAPPAAELITFDSAMRRFFHSEDRKADIVRKVLSGELRIYGNGAALPELLLERSAVERVRTQSIELAHEDSLTAMAAAEVINCNVLAIKPLCQCGYLSPHPTYPERFTRESVTKFASCYVAGAALATRVGSPPKAAARLCRLHSIATVAVDYGYGVSTFVTREDGVRLEELLRVQKQSGRTPSVAYMQPDANYSSQLDGTIRPRKSETASCATA